MSETPIGSGFRVLVVDDEDAVRRIHARILSDRGYQVDTAPDGVSAIAMVCGTAAYDLIISDLEMPGMTGLELLEGVRARDLDVPVVFITGSPSVETASRAMEHGALRYLVKPVGMAALLKVAADGVRFHRIAVAKRRALDHAGGIDRLLADQAGLTGSFGRALDLMNLVYQPIVSWSGRRVYAYEALLRSREPGLANPAALLDAAERLGRLPDLGRRIRAEASACLPRLPADVCLFVNLHPSDLLDDQLFAKNAPLSAHARRVVLEITERATLHDIHDIRARMTALRALGFRIAIDDLGAGYAGLTSFALLEPDVVKLDIGLVRDVHREPTKLILVRTMVAACNELGIVVTAEGIEVPEERDQLVLAGCDLLQGYLFARPGEPFPEPRY